MLVPPQINKFYIMDLAPKRSLTEYAVARGVPFFTVSWRNPRPEHRNWGLDEYVTALKDALDAVCEISGSPDRQSARRMLRRNHLNADARPSGGRWGPPHQRRVR